MIEYLKGRVVEKYPTHLIVEVNGIGYRVNISLSTYSALKDDCEKILVHQVIREDAHLLYGFATADEREVFRSLISVSGIGVNTARTILSSMDAQGVRAAILSGDVNAFKNVKGIGLKTAQRVIIDLKGSIGETALGAPAGEAMGVYDIRREALDAMEVLGFARKAAEPVVDRIIRETPGLTVEKLVKLTLKSL